jgi:hypothetical protein
VPKHVLRFLEPKSKVLAIGPSVCLSVNKISWSFANLLSLTARSRVRFPTGTYKSQTDKVRSRNGWLSPILSSSSVLERLDQWFSNFFAWRPLWTYSHFFTPPPLPYPTPRYIIFTYGIYGITKREFESLRFFFFYHYSSK